MRIDDATAYTPETNGVSVPGPIFADVFERRLAAANGIIESVIMTQSGDAPPISWHKEERIDKLLDFLEEAIGQIEKSPTASDED